MHIALLALGGVADYHGGGRVFVNNLSQALRNQGITTTVVTSPADFPADADVAHFVGLNPSASELARRIKGMGIPVMLYPIFSESRIYNGYKVLWPLLENPLVSGIAGFRKLVVFVCGLAGILEVKRNKKRFASLISEVDHITCTSEFEAGELSRVFSIKKPKLLIHSGVSIRFSSSSPAGEEKNPSLVLMVGRMEPRKNPAALIRALRNSKHKLVIVGPGQDSESLYAMHCRKLCSGHSNMKLAGEINDSRLAALYQSASVFVLPSWAEVASLALLEAAVSRCNIVTTRTHSAAEYFDGLVYFHDPWDIEELRRQVELASAGKLGDALNRLALSNYMWERVAEEAIAAYQYALIHTRISEEKKVPSSD